MIAISGNDNASETVRVSALTTETLTANDFVLYMKAVTGNATVNLPAVALTQPGRPYTVVKDGAAFTVTLDGASAETINGAATNVLASGAFHGVTVVNTGTEWIIRSTY